MKYYIVGVFYYIIFIQSHKIQSVENEQFSQFSCQGRPSGYYADVKTGCQFYHMCDGLGRQFTYTCPNATLFQQRMLICDHWYMVDCSNSEEQYSANLLIGQRDKPFVEDSEKQRTPRPDLLTNPTEIEFNLYSRNSRLLSSSNINKVVGIDRETDDKNDESQMADESSYVVPNHWSTHIPVESTTKIPNRNNPNRMKNFTTSPKLINDLLMDVNNGNDSKEIRNVIRKKLVGKVKIVAVNYPSNYENTTPKFPTFVSEKDKNSNFEETPLSSANSKKVIMVNFPSDYENTTPKFPTFVSDKDKDSSFEERPLNTRRKSNSSTNFPSNFENTTPKFPTFVSDKDKNSFYEEVPLVSINNNSRKRMKNVQVNFPSGFENTTPKFPTFVSDKDKDSSFEERPLLNILSKSNNLSKDTSIDEIDKNFGIETKIKNVALKPSEINKFLEPTKITNFVKKQKRPEISWQDLRRKFLIPDVVFPIDMISRPYVENAPNSFQVKSVPVFVTNNDTKIT